MEAVTKKAYGKVNLFLSVGGKRSDGRHDVETVLCRVGVYDTVTVRRGRAGEIKLTCDDSALPVNEENIAYLAAMRYFEHVGACHGVDIDIKKRIPVKAGMGGGSSDAAAVLLALDELYGELSFDTLLEIAASLGADVPFFLYEKDIMLGKGTGAELFECGELGFKGYGVFVSHGEKLSTGKAYERLDNIRGNANQLKKADKLLLAIAEKDLFGVAGAIENDFELCYESFEEIADALYGLGCSKAFLCGSGPTVCGLFDSLEGAERACVMLRYKTFVAKLGI